MREPHRARSVRPRATILARSIGCGFAVALQAIAECAHEGDVHVSAQECARRRLHAAPPAPPSSRSAGGGFYLGDHLAGEPGDLRGLLGTLAPQAPHGLGYGGILREIRSAGFAAGAAQGCDQLLSPNVRARAGRSGEEGQERKRMVPGAAAAARPCCAGFKAQGVGFDRGTA